MTIQPIEVIRIEIEDTPARDAVIIGKPFNWVRLCLYFALMALAFGVGIELCYYLKLFGY